MTIKKNDVFVKVMLKDNVKLKSTQLGRNLKEILSFQLKKKYEGICTHHGYILEGSISVQSYSAGKIIDISLNGDILYSVSYYAYICNPCIGGIIKCKTINKNKFGLLAISEIEIEDNKIQILEIIVPQTMSDTTEINVDEYIYIEIVGKKFELHDKKISIIGKLSEKKNENLQMEYNEEYIKEELYMSDIGESDIDEEDDDEDAEEAEVDPDADPDAEVEPEIDEIVPLEDDSEVESEYCSGDDSDCSNKDDD